MAETFTILAIPGSLRRHSFNRGLTRAAREVAPEAVTIEIADIADIPLYNADLDVEGGPEPVRRFKERIANADALLLITPEYNYSVPGVLKNAIDWASRPPQSSPLRQKPVGIIGASGGRSGTMRAQLAWRQVFVFTESIVMPKPELYVAEGRDLFDAEGNLLDDDIRRRLRDYLAALVKWTARVRD